MSEPERCVCPEFQDAVQEGAVIAQTWGLGQEVRMIYLLPHPSREDDDAHLMLFCPFCGQKSIRWADLPCRAMGGQLMTGGKKKT